MSGRFYHWGFNGSLGIQVLSPDAQPNFYANVSEALDLIKSKPVGAALLQAIEESTPAASSSPAASPGLDAANFPPGVKVIIMPFTMIYVQSGYRLDGSVADGNATLEPDERRRTDEPFYRHRHPTSRTEAADQVNDTNGRGCAALVHWSNADMNLDNGFVSPPFIVLAHELIHAYHILTGVRGRHHEENWTRGVAPYGQETFTENAIRREHGLPLRVGAVPQRNYL